MTFGQTIASERRSRGLSQKHLASQILKEDGTPISPQYLNDIERDRRNAPPDHLIGQFADVLELDSDTLFFLAGQFPPQDRDGRWPRENVQRAFEAFRRELGDKSTT